MSSFKRIQKQRERQLKPSIGAELYFTLFGLAINEVYGWKDKPITKIMKSVDNMVTDVTTGRVTFEQLKQKLKDNTGLTLEFK